MEKTHDSSENDKRLIETPRIYNEPIPLPQRLARRIGARTASILRIVNEHSLSEKTGGGRPDYWEMVFWWTRKPLAGARFVIASSLLSHDTNVKKLAKALQLLEDRTAHSLNPDLSLLGNQEAINKIKSAKLLDPFAGFGSIPLEAIRLGVSKVVAVELLPTAYVFLKAVLEYPSKFSKIRTTVPHSEARELREIIDWETLKRKGLAKETPQGIEAPALIVDVARWGKWITDKLREDPDIRELYDDDIAVYIGTWEIKCPGTNKYSPMIGNMWLARVRQGNRYTRLAYMQPKKNENNDIEIEIIDLNKIHGDVSNARVEGNKIIINGREYTVPEPNISPQSNTAICLQDNTPLGYIDPETGKTYPDRRQAPSSIRERLEWYPKWALKQWNRILEEYLEGKTSLDQLKNAPARPRILAKVKTSNGLEFEPATQEDTEKLWKALEKLQQIWGDPDIPTEPIAIYENRRITPILGAKYWYQFFNPRQLLALVKLVKLIREAGKKVEEKLKESWSDKEAYMYAEVVTTYLTIALLKHVNYNSIVTSTEPTQKLIRETLAFRGIAMTWNWMEEHPSSTVLGSLSKSLSSVVSSLSYLFSAVSVNSSGVIVLLDDATMLSKLGNESFNVIVTDPPYYDDVPYSELSDFYYVWLKRALSDVEDGRLCPRFLGEAFFRRVGGVWREKRTQWEEVARREISVNLGRLGNAKLEDAVRWFEERLGAAFKNISKLLSDDGLLVTYYNHTSVNAWASLLRAGWEIGGFRVSAAVPLVTESGNRVTARNKVRLDTSIVVVWRKRVNGGKCDLSVVEEEALSSAREFVDSIVERSGVVGYDVLFAGLGAALSVLTRCDSIVTPRGVLDSRGVAEVAYRVAGRAVAEALAGVAGAVVASGPGRFYVMTRVLFAEAGDIRLDGSSIGLLQIALGIDRDSLVRLSVLERSRSDYILLYPRRVRGVADIEALLRRRGLERDPGRALLRSSIDVLHLLYYGAARGRLEVFAETLRMRARGMYEEALGIARTLCKLLPSNDPEKGLACRVAGGGGGLDAWLGDKG